MPIVRLPGGDLRDEIRQPLYDTLSLSTIAGVGVVGTSANDFDNQQFFSNIQGKAKWQTNLRQPNLLETAVSFRMQGMALDALYSNTAAAVSKSGLLPAVQEFGSLRVRIGEKDYWEGPLPYLMGRIEQNAATTVAATSIVLQRAGAQAVQGVILAGRHVVDINPLQSFFAQIQMSVPTAIDAAQTVANDDYLNLKFSFKGLLRRPVQ